MVLTLAFAQWVDIDNDGDLDLSSSGSSAPIVVFLNKGYILDDDLVLESDPKTETTFALAWGDVDGDGTLELAAGQARNSCPYNELIQPWDTWANAHNLIYQVTDDGLVASPTLWSPAISRTTLSLAWGDVDGDGDLDLAVGNRPQNDGGVTTNNGENELYLNSGSGLAATPVSTFGDNDATTIALAWGDINADGKLDLVTGDFSTENLFGFARLHLNNNGSISGPADWSSADSGPIIALDLGDVDNDGDLDLVVAEYLPSFKIKVYINHNGQLSSEASQEFVAGLPYSVDLGDYDADGDLDLAIGVDGGSNLVFDNDGGSFNTEASWFSGDADFKSRVAWGDMNGDGLLDLTSVNGAEVDTRQVRPKIYLNQQGTLSQQANWYANKVGRYNAVVLGDANNDGRLDLAVGLSGDDLQPFSKTETDRVFLNPGLIEVESASRPEIYIDRYSDPANTFNSQTSTALATANFYSVPGVRDSSVISLTYTVANATGSPMRFVKAFYSPDGGGQWFPAISANAVTPTNTIAQLAVSNRVSSSQKSGSAYSPARYEQPHIFNWDVLNSGFFGQSDNVVFRLEAYHSYTPTQNSASESEQQAYVSTQSYPFRVRGTQVQVLNGTTPVSGALVYRLPPGKSVGGLALRGRENFTTDQNGYLQGQGQIAVGDRLLALAPVDLPPEVITRFGNTMSLYHTNGTPTNNGLTAYTVTEPGLQTLVVSPANPLMLFDLDVSLEWDASSDPAYVRQLEFDLNRASEHLYDFTDGQVALGDIHVYQNAERWSQSHILVHSTNRLRPHATIGGVVLTNTADISPTLGITYSIGQVHMGAEWNRYGNPAQSIGVDWPVILAHELSHYLLFLEDTYLGLEEFDGAEVLTSVDSCRGSAMGDVYNINNTEFVGNDTVWQDKCGNTLAAQELGRSEWQTMVGYYPWLKQPPGTMPGPSLMPFDLTSVSVFAPLFPADAIEDPTFYLDYWQREVSSSEARAFLLRNAEGTGSGIDDFDYVYDLGNPVGGQNRVLARGAAPGDRLCVFDQARSQFGCEVITPGDERLRLRKDEKWQPVIQISPVNSTTFELQVSGVVTDLELKARLFPEFGEAFTVTTLSPVDGGYAGSLALDYPALKGHVQLWADKDPTSPRLETMVAYRVGGNPGNERGGGGNERGGGGNERGGGGNERGGGGNERGGGGNERGGGGNERGGGGNERGGGGNERGGGGNARGEGNAPAVSPDGQMIYFDRNYDLAEGQFYTVQVMAGLPPLPEGKTAIGRGYNLFATGFGPDSLTGSVSFQYRGNDVLAEERSETELGIYFWDGQRWRSLNTDVDTIYNIASARSQGPGIYALLAGVTVPIINTVTPAGDTNEIDRELIITGRDFLEPVRVTLVGPTVTYTLPLQSASPVSITASISKELPAGEYSVQVINGNQPGGQATAIATGTYAIFDPVENACFFDTFESGSSKWELGGEWGLANLPNGGTITDSPNGNYNSATGPASLRFTSINTKEPIDLGLCPNPVLTFRHDYVLANLGSSWDIARVQISTNGENWRNLRSPYRRGGIYDRGYSGSTARPESSQEWADADWKSETIDLSRFAGKDVYLRFLLQTDQTVADKGWVIDDVIVKSASTN